MSDGGEFEKKYAQLCLQYPHAILFIANSFDKRVMFYQPVFCDQLQQRILKVNLLMADLGKIGIQVEPIEDAWVIKKFTMSIQEEEAEGRHWYIMSVPLLKERHLHVMAVMKEGVLKELSVKSKVQKQMMQVLGVYVNLRKNTLGSMGNLFSARIPAYTVNSIEIKGRKNQEIFSEIINEPTFSDLL